MNPPLSAPIGIEMFGVTLNLRCDREEQLRFSADLLRDFVRPAFAAPDLEVAGHWLTPLAGEDLDRPLFDLTGLDAFGKRMHLGADELVWSETYRDKNLQLRFRRRGAGAAFDVAYQYRPSDKKLARFPGYEGKKLFELVRYLVLFPIAWQLRRTRGWELIHASAVADGERAVLIAGPGGAGKTTTAVALVAQAGMQLLTENLVFTDGARIYPLVEPVRLTDESLELLGSAAEDLFERAGALKQKAMFVPRGEPRSTGVRAALLFLPRFSGQGYLRRIPPAEACQHLRASNFLTLELNDFYWYAAALQLLWPEENQAEERVRDLTRAVPTYALGIDRSAGVAPVVERILECLHGRPQAVLGEEGRR